MSVCGRVASGGSHGRDNGETGAEGQPPAKAFPTAFAGVIGPDQPALPGQLLSSDLIFLSNSSNEVSPLILSPLMKNVGVESTFSTSLAYF
jgi:hypothetical protein